jgi:dihydrofolate reductase
MKKICYSVAMSLDGFIAGANGEADWIPMDPEVDFADIWSRFDILLMGRRTYEFAREGFEKFGTEGSRIVVVSRTLRSEEHPGLLVISELGPASIAGLRAEARKDIWLFGGGELFRSLLGIGEVDRVEVSVIPVLLGRGIRLLPDCIEQTHLKLVEHKIYRSGRLALKYEVQR